MPRRYPTGPLHKPTTLGDEGMPRVPCLARLNGGPWGLRRRVPAELRQLIKKGEIWVSYEGVSFAQAKARHPAEMAKVERLFAEARRGLRLGTVGELHSIAPLPAPTRDELVAAIRRWFHAEECKRVARQIPNDPADFHAALEGFPAANAFLTSELGWSDANAQLEAILATAGFGAPVDDVRRVAVEMIQRAMVESHQRDWDRYLGRKEVGHDAAFSQLTFLSPEPLQLRVVSLTLGSLIARYLAAPERASLSPKTKLKYAGFARVMKEIMGDGIAAASIDRSACRSAQEVLLRLPANARKKWPQLAAPDAADKARRDGLRPMHPKSAGNHLDFLAAVFRFGIREQLLPSNPASGLNASTAKGAVPLAGTERRRPFTTEELKVIFAAPLYVGCRDDLDGYATPGPVRPRRGRFWVPLLSMFGGLRLNEACQLYTDDVVVVDDVPLLLIRADADGTRLKTVASQRRVPIHPELIRIGFLQHVARVREAGEHRLFADLPLGKMGNFADPFSKWFGRFLAKAGVPAQGAVFHSFRHGWRDRLRDADVHREVADALGGWAGQGQGAAYGSGFQATMLGQSLGKLSYEGLDLSHLHTGLGEAT